MYRIAIQPDDQKLMSGRRQSFSARWVERAAAAGHEARLVDAYGPDVAAQLEGCDAFMWWFAHLPAPRLFAKRLLPAIEHGLGVPVFPSWRTGWHFDDKIGQQYLLEACGVPTPRTWIFWRRDAARDFCRGAAYPMVLKLTGGIVSENVRLVRSAAEAEYWIERLFGAGVVGLQEPDRVGAAAEAVRRLRRAAAVLRGHVPAPPTSRRTELQRGYLLVQEFVPGNEFDTRVVVIGDRAYAFRRFNRPGDFRASGSGLRDPDPAAIDRDALRRAFRIARHLRTQSLALDFLRRPDGRLLVNEISYYYEGWVLHEECPGHWRLGGDPDGGALTWVDRRVRPEDAIWDDFVAGLADGARGRVAAPRATVWA